MGYKNKLYTQWSDYERIPKKLLHEQHICVLKGKENFKLVSPIFRKNIYAGVNEEYDKNYTPINFFNLDKKQYPLVELARIINATLNAGDCLYVPAYYYIQS